MFDSLDSSTKTFCSLSEGFSSCCNFSKSLFWLEASPVLRLLAGLACLYLWCFRWRFACFDSGLSRVSCVAESMPLSSLKVLASGMMFSESREYLLEPLFSATVLLVCGVFRAATCYCRRDALRWPLEACELVWICLRSS